MHVFKTLLLLQNSTINIEVHALQLMLLLGTIRPYFNV
jgi:hypothetical protein